MKQILRLFFVFSFFSVVLLSAIPAAEPEDSNIELLESYQKQRAHINALEKKRGQIDFTALKLSREDTEIHGKILAAKLRIVKLVHENKNAFVNAGDKFGVLAQETQSFHEEVLVATLWLEGLINQSLIEPIESETKLDKVMKHLDKITTAAIPAYLGSAAYFFLVNQDPRANLVGALFSGGAAAGGLYKAFSNRRKRSIATLKSIQLEAQNRIASGIFWLTHDEVRSWDTGVSPPITFKEFLEWLETVDKALRLDCKDALTG